MQKVVHSANDRLGPGERRLRFVERGGWRVELLDSLSTASGIAHLTLV